MSVNIFNKSTGSIAQIAGNATGGGGTTVTVDNILSATSENPVQNKVITEELNKKADQTTVDSALSLKANSTDVTASLAGKSDTGHTHDDRYYTESETNALLDDKVEVSVFDSHANNTTVHVTAEEKAVWDSKANLTDIPTSLPANGGNAATVGNLSPNSLVRNLGAVSDTDFLNSPNFSEYSYECDIDPTTALALGLLEKWYIIKGFKFINDGKYAVQIAYPRNHVGQVMFRYGNGTDWITWKGIGDGGAAATANYAGSLASTTSNICLRNISAGTADLTAGTTALTTGAIYLVYE